MWCLRYFCTLFCLPLFFIAEASYTYNPQVNATVWNELEPYFLPEDHPIKSKLDKIFSTAKIINSADTIKKAGFKLIRSSSAHHILVAKHKKIKGYLAKIYSNEQLVGDETYDFKQRIIGSIVISDAIERLGYGSLFKVPKKWIYPLPNDSLPHQKHFILIVEDMKILNKDNNHLFWRSIVMDRERMRALYHMIQDQGLYDSVYPDNIPFCKDDKQAFVDTQHFHRWPINYEKLTPFMPAKLQPYWNKITAQ